MENADSFDAIRLKYAKKYPDSDVALWFLIERFCLNRYSDLSYTTMESFPQRIKK